MGRPWTQWLLSNLFLVTVLTNLLGVSPACADTLEKIFIMPGPVIEAHAEFEADCKSCHAPLSDTPQVALCVACHEDVGADIELRSGYHGRDPRARDSDCASCHADHEGRDAKVVLLDADRFDHGFTNFTLLGAHADVDCDACHVPGERFRVADSQCVACHRDDDVHAGALGEACGDCHNAADWRFVRFDHDSTGFALTGGHKSASCDACHATQDYAATPTECVACHRDDDVHKGRNGSGCADCHVTANWSQVTFNHARETGFSLTNGHGGLDCQDCHRAEDFTGLRGDDCNACHVDDDVHNGRNGTDCASCHATTIWTTVAFDHFSASGFALLGAHNSLQCDTCHLTNVQDALPRDCGGCHGEDDPHAGQLGIRCGDCHGELTWTTGVRFEHDLTRFPLIGRHAELACDQCHATSAFHDVEESCNACHEQDDPHAQTLGQRCETCHSPRDWRAWDFDHNRQTAFALTGSHVDLACADCHTEPVSGDGAMLTSQDCASCHRRDDSHQGRFGAECNACHTTKSFRDIREL